MYNTNNNKAEQQNEYNKEVISNDRVMKFLHIIGEASLKPRSSIPSKLEELAELNMSLDEFGGDNARIRMHISDVCLKIARALAKLFAGSKFSVYDIACIIDLGYEEVLKYVRANKKTSSPKSKAVTHNEAVEFVRALVEGDKPRSNGFAKDLKHAALLIAFRKSQGNPSEFVDVDEALNKVYASARRQGKKNGDDLGGKSNNPTKTACKALILEALLRMIENHEYKFDVIIGEASNK
jgi:hypothetical protein